MTETHKEKMQLVQDEMRQRIRSAKSKKGIILVLTGDGKGKSTSGFGTVARAVGHGKKAAVVQFIKGKWSCGERTLLESHGVHFAVMKTGFTWDTQDKEGDTAAAQAVWLSAKAMLSDPEIDLVLLDEVTYMLNYGYLAMEDVMSAIDKRPTHQHVIVTGRDCPGALMERADTVSEVKNIKHAFDSGIVAQKGFDF